MKNENVIYRFQQQDNVHEIYIYDEIKKTGPFNWETWQYEDSETSAKHFKELLDAIPETDEIKIYFNSNGGSVDQGTAIYNMLKQHGSYKTGIVMGVCHSIAFTILQACDKRIMGQGTTAIIHDMWETVTGNAADLRAEADNLDVAMESCIALFMQRAKISEDEVREMMHKETTLSPQKIHLLLTCLYCGILIFIVTSIPSADSLARVVSNTESSLYQICIPVDLTFSTGKSCEQSSSILRSSSTPSVYSGIAIRFHLRFHLPR